MNTQINAGGRPGDVKLDCSVRALAIATGREYAVAENFWSARGRRRNRRLKWLVLLSALRGEVLGCPVIQLITGRPTVKKFLETYPTGRYLLATRGHICAIIDGVVHDIPGAFPTERQPVKFAWQLWIKK